jgi:hypothetical protein
MQLPQKRILFTLPCWKIVAIEAARRVTIYRIFLGLKAPTKTAPIATMMAPHHTGA